MQNNPNIDATRIKGRLQLDASTTTESSLNLIPGTGPTTKTSGDIHIEADRLMFTKADLTTKPVAFLEDIPASPPDPSDKIQRAINMATYRF